MSETTTLQLTAGTSNLRLGQTRLTAMLYDRPMRRPVAVDWHRTAMLRENPDVRDTVIRNINASSSGAALGQWVTRNITIPNETPITLAYKVNLSGSLTNSVSVPIVVSEDYPLCELEFPVLTDSKSSLDTLLIQGRFMIATEDQVKRLWHDDDMYTGSVRQLMDEFGGLSTGKDWALHERFQYCIRQEEKTALMSVYLGGNIPDKDITVRCLARSTKTEGVSVTKKSVPTTVTGKRSAVILKKRRKINL